MQLIPSTTGVIPWKVIYFLEVNPVIVNCFSNSVDVTPHPSLFVLVLGSAHVSVSMELSVVSVVYHEDLSSKLSSFPSWTVLWLL